MKVLQFLTIKDCREYLIRYGLDCYFVLSPYLSPWTSITTYIEFRSLAGLQKKESTASNNGINEIEIERSEEYDVRYLDSKRSNQLASI